ncbi:MAG TPA: sulfotransferase [Acidimicrobiia bacterium]|nr:sulfotransferase [Acidimicrobiia bacterium]
MNVDALCEAAAFAAGTDDFGDPSYRDGLDALVASLRDEAALSELGAIALEAQITRMLTNRLRILDWHRNHPELATTPVTRPLIVVGLPRTGTTLLSYLLDCDPAHRSLLRWEALDPVPPPDTATLTTDPRVAQAAADEEALHALNPQFRAMHYEAPDGPTECVTLLAHDFRSLLWETLANIPSYSEWLLAHDQHSAYAHHRRCLQVLQSRAPGRWSLKTPHHCLALPELLAQYPDACLVMTHRDPLTVTASVSSLVRSLSGTWSETDHRDYIARHWPDVLVECVRRVAAHRAAHPEQEPQWFDLPYDALVRDPIGSVERIYAHFDDELTGVTRTRLEAYVAAHPQGEHGPHRYSLDDFGIDAGELRERFDDAGGSVIPR